ncbi:uncharacterized protein LOC125855004 [Solanum stenotomum]|uniref:uncharacterized protein LOC125855004 n=1 Tax=Solanum stenotomum TaxID=172797 RepID=UPI0020D1917F|nr:uncharacterized protein LOC125855004 [Solanum stenotomum]
MAPFEALYSRRCRSPVGWFESTETRLHGTNFLQEVLDHVMVIHDKLRTAQIGHQSYVYRRRRALRFVISDRVFLLVSPMSGVKKFRRRGKLSPRYIGPFEILRIFVIHPVFHISMLRQYVLDESHVLQYDGVELDDRLTYIEEPVAILARDVRQLRSKIILVIKVCWSHRPVEEATLKTEQEMREQFLGLFKPSGWNDLLMAIELGVLSVMLGWPSILFLDDSPLFMVQFPQFTPPGVVQVHPLIRAPATIIDIEPPSV